MKNNSREQKEALGLARVDFANGSNVSKPKIEAEPSPDTIDNTFDHDINADKCKFHDSYLYSACPVCHQNQKDMMFIEGKSVQRFKDFPEIIHQKRCSEKVDYEDWINHLTNIFEIPILLNMISARLNELAKEGLK